MQQPDFLQGTGINGLNIISPGNCEELCLGQDVRLARGRVHELQGDSNDIFALVAASCLECPIFWIGLGKDISTLAPTGIEKFLDPARIVLVEGVSRLEVLWASEQALRSIRMGCVVIELNSGPGLKESRRLQVASEEGGTLGFVLVGGRVQTSAAETRWKCSAINDRHMAWQWECTKNRRGRLGTWRVNWQENGNGPNTVHMVPAAAA